MAAKGARKHLVLASMYSVCCCSIVGFPDGVRNYYAGVFPVCVIVWWQHTKKQKLTDILELYISQLFYFLHQNGGEIYE